MHVGYLQANAYSDCCTSNGALFTFADNAGLAHAGWEYFIQARSTANSGYPGYLLLQCDGSGCVVGNSGGATGGQAQSGDVVFLGGLGWTI